MKRGDHANKKVSQDSHVFRPFSIVFASRDRLQVLAILVVVSLASMLVLPSQSASSFPTYVLAIVLLLSFSAWKDVFDIGLFRLCIVLVLWMCISSFWSQPFDSRAMLSVTIRGVLTLCFVVAIAECQFRDQLQRWIGNSFSWVGGITASAALAVFFATAPPDGRLNGLGQLNTHVTAALVYGALLLFILHGLLGSKLKGWGQAGWIALVPMVAAIFLSDSRNAWVSVSAGLMVLVLAHKVDRGRFIVALASAITLSLSLVAVLLSVPEYVEILLPRSDSFRIAIWSEVLNRLSGQPLFGLGITTNDDVVLDGIRFLHPHNMYLAVAFQAGVVGLVLYLCLLAGAIKTLLDAYDHTDAKLGLSVLALALSAHLLDENELLDKIGASWLLVWLPIAISIGVRWRQRT